MKRWGEKWTSAEDQILAENWARPVAEWVCLLGRGEQAIYARGRKLGWRRPRRQPYFEPSFAEWHQAAKIEAAAEGIPALHVINGKLTKRLRGASVARWRAWRRLKASGRYSIAGIGRATGWHHTSILHGLRRLEEVERGVA